MMQFDVIDTDTERAITGLVRFLSPAVMSAFLAANMGPYLRRRARDRFISEGDDASGPWEPLKPATQAIREASNYPVAPDSPINRRSGELENWVVQGGWEAYPHALGASMRYPAKRPTGELRDKVETAQKGRKNPSTVPRPVLAVNETDMLFFIAALHAGIEEAVR